jgi:hypothetical protein
VLIYGLVTGLLVEAFVLADDLTAVLSVVE